jgi:hypothetical protein
MTVYEHPAATVSGRFQHAPGVRIAVVQGSAPDDWRTVYERLNNSSKQLATVLAKGSAAVAAFAGIAAVSGLLAMAILEAHPDISPHYLACAVILPGLLAGAAAAQFAGNLFLRLWFRLDDSSRRGFATRLSLGRCPADWPAFLKRWLFTGDWLGSPAYDLRLPYVRIYIEGDAPETCREEDYLWREIHGNISGDSLWEAGTNIREISYPRELPSWARQVENGDGYAELRRRIGSAAASEWISHIWRRACRQWPALRVQDYPEQARRECFEMHSVALTGGRNALVVVLRPVTFVLELEDGEHGEGSIAA